MCQRILECGLLTGTWSAEGIMASGHVNRTQRPNTWLHRPSLRREESSCQPGAVHTWPRATDPDVRFSNRPFEVKRFQTIHHHGVDVAHGLVLLFGIGTKALPSWDSRRGGTISHSALPLDGRCKRTCGLTSSIVPRGTSFHRSVELEFPPIAFDPARFSCRGDLPGPPELGAVNPYAVHDHGQPSSQGHDRLFHSSAPGDLHRPGLEP